MSRLWAVHRETAKTLNFPQTLVSAEQVHGNRVANITEPQGAPVAGVDGLISNRANICLAIYVADCAAVFLADRKTHAIGLVHSGKKGTELGIVVEAINAMKREYGTDPRDLVLQIAPCIRPPHYEIDFAADILRQAREAGVNEVYDCGTCTASNPEMYYSYRREMGKTGRLLALLALK
ncbi:hypothetical protein BH09VER1_BH09VER1_19560 [soil metagenome]